MLDFIDYSIRLYLKEKVFNIWVRLGLYFWDYVQVGKKDPNDDESDVLGVTFSDKKDYISKVKDLQ